MRHIRTRYDHFWSVATSVVPFQSQHGITTLAGNLQSAIQSVRRLILLFILGAIIISFPHTIFAAPKAIFTVYDESTQTEKLMKLNPGGMVTTIVSLSDPASTLSDWDVSNNTLWLLFDNGANSFSWRSLNIQTDSLTDPVILPECISGKPYLSAQIKGNYVLAKTVPSPYSVPPGADLVLINISTNTCQTVYDSTTSTSNDFYLNIPDTFDFTVNPDGSKDILSFGWGYCSTDFEAMAIHRHINTDGTLGPLNKVCNQPGFGAVNPRVRGASGTVASDIVAVFATEANVYFSPSGTSFYFTSVNGGQPTLTEVPVAPDNYAWIDDITVGSNLASYEVYDSLNSSQSIVLANSAGTVATLDTISIDPPSGYFSNTEIRKDIEFKIGVIKTTIDSNLIPTGNTLQIYQVPVTTAISPALVGEFQLSAGIFPELLLHFELVTNQPPTLAPIGDKSVNEGNLLNFTVSGSDPDGDPLAYSATVLPTGATFNESTREFQWTPGCSQSGTYTVTFEVSDGSLSDSEVVSIIVNNVNCPPVLDTIGSYWVYKNDNLSFTISGSDPDGDVVNFSAENLPAGADFNTTTLTFSWTPAANQVGSYDVIFTINDGLLSDSETAQITVYDSNGAKIVKKKSVSKSPSGMNEMPGGKRAFKFVLPKEDILSTFDLEISLINMEPSDATVTVTTFNTCPTAPEGYQIGDVCFDVNTTATYYELAIICITYDDTTVNENKLKLMHYEGGIWSDITTTKDTAANIICGETTTLSPFIMVESIDSNLTNISTRGPVQTGDSVMIGGFIISGTVPRSVLIRGFGPTLADFGVPGVLSNPYIDLYSGQTMIATNDNWQTPITQCDAPAVSCGTPQDIQATGKSACSVATTGCSQDAAILVTLPPGAYTAIMRGVGGGTGVGLIGVDDNDTSPLSKLVNISTRGPVLTGDSVMIGGFIIDAAAGSKQVLIRGFGPTLADWGVTGAMSNPYIELYSGQTMIATNDNWQTPITKCDAPAISCGTPQDIQATGKDACSVATTGCSQDAAIVVTLPPGAYTAIVRGVSGGTGVGLVGIDEIGP